jgi:hypothetical protein
MREKYSSTTLTSRIIFALQGEIVTGASGICDDLCDLLESGADLSPELRRELIAALLRGRGGNVAEDLSKNGQQLPRLSIKDFGDAGELAKLRNKRHEWIEAAMLVEDYVSDGDSVGFAESRVQKKYSLGPTWMRDCRRFLRDFRREFSNPQSFVHDAPRSLGLLEDGEDYQDLACSSYIERTAVLPPRRGGRQKETTGVERKQNAGDKRKRITKDAL